VQEWEELLAKLSSINLGLEEDLVTWKLEKNGHFTTRSLYRWLSFRGVKNKRAEKIWRSKLPMKIKVFMWLANQNRLPTKTKMKERKWKGELGCTICGARESLDHIMFTCVLARFIWTCLKEALGWVRIPNNLGDFLEIWLPTGTRDYQLKLFVFSFLFWGLWTTRNKSSIDGVFPKSPTEPLFKILSFLQKWRLVLKEHNRKKLEVQTQRVVNWLGEFTSIPRSTGAEDLL